MIKSILGSLLLFAVGATLLFITGTLAVRAIGSQTGLERSIVKVLNADATGGGTGWVTTTSSGTRVIVTNDHVCQVSNNGAVRIQDDTGKNSIKRVLRRSFERDLCVIDGIDAPTLRLAEKIPMRFDEIHVMGHPLLNPTAPSSGVFTGTILFPFIEARPEGGTCREGATPITVKTFFGDLPACKKVEELNTSTVRVAHGSSGSPVLNSSGEVVGVINSMTEDDNGMFIPLPYVKQILTD